MVSLFWSPAKDHVTGYWAWSHLISTSGKALLTVITLEYFIESRISHAFQGSIILVRAHPLLAQYLHEHTGHPKALVNTPLQEDENENFLDEVHVGAVHFARRQRSWCLLWVTSFASETLPAFTGAIPRLHSWGRHLSSILERSILPKDFYSLWRSPLTGTMATLPSHLPQVTSNRHLAIKYRVYVKDDVCLHWLE